MRIILDIFPAHLAVLAAGVTDDITSLTSMPTSAGATYVGTTRVVVTDTAVFVAADSPTGPVIIFQEQYSELLYPEIKTKDIHIVTVSGKMLAFKKDNNCGCGSRLRGWNPYKTLDSIKDVF